VPLLDRIDQLREKRFTPQPVIVEHGLRAGELPLLHKDPFDRLLGARELDGSTIVATLAA
jgi:PIN domain nuclease of toxin-antitoxin system